MHGAEQSVLSVSQSVVQKNTEICPICTQYTALKNIEINEKCIYFPSYVPAHGSFAVVLAIPKISELRSAYYNCKLCTNTDGMHG